MLTFPLARGYIGLVQAATPNFTVLLLTLEFLRDGAHLRIMQFIYVVAIPGRDKFKRA